MLIRIFEAGKKIDQLSKRQRQESAGMLEYEFLGLIGPKGRRLRRFQRMSDLLFGIFGRDGDKFRPGNTGVEIDFGHEHSHAFGRGIVAEV